MPAPSTARLGGPAAAWRIVSTVALVAAVCAGTFWWQDGAWPFAPMKMYATSADPSGVVAVVALEAQVDGGPWRSVPLTPEDVGMNRAEAEGQASRLASDPALLGQLADTHARLVPGAPLWSGLRLVRVSTVLEDRVPTGEVRREVVVTWQR